MSNKLILLGIRGVPASHGGFETFAENLGVYLVNKVSMFVGESEIVSNFLPHLKKFLLEKSVKLEVIGNSRWVRNLDEE